MTITLTTIKTSEYSCRPSASLSLAEHADVLDSILDALEADVRALGPVLSYDDASQRVEALFQVEVKSDRLNPLDTAGILARHIFDAALESAGLEQRTAGLAIVEGGDPELLP